MRPQNLLKQRAAGIATHLAGKIPDLEKYIAQMTRELEVARAATARAEDFPMMGGEYWPRCWITGGEVAPLVRMDSKNPRADSFRCNRCHEAFDFKF
jgi:hypothetical protein